MQIIQNKAHPHIFALANFPWNGEDHRVDLIICTHCGQSKAIFYKGSLKTEPIQIQQAAHEAGDFVNHHKDCQPPGGI